MIEINKRSVTAQLFSLPVIVSALGYFVDVYDILLFSIVRIASLKSFGLNDVEISLVGASILNYQMIGMLVGGIIWGVLGDKRGRMSALFMTIIVYSLASVACGFVQDIEQYKWLRFIAGVGLAGELGVGITLVSETIAKEIRSLATSIVAGIGVLGAVAAFLTSEWFDWRMAYIVGGGLGISLLFLRVGVMESGMFENIKKNTEIERGNFFSFFTNGKRFITYLKCIGMGCLPWFGVGIFATFGNEIGKFVGVINPVKPGLCTMWIFLGLAIGDLLSGMISHVLASRKKAIVGFVSLSLISMMIILFAGITSDSVFYFMYVVFGIGLGYWAMFNTIAAEQFGTNLRSTAATTVPNMVRGTVAAMVIFYQFLKPDSGVIMAAFIVGMVTIVITYISVFTSKETHGIDLDFIDKH